ncbi:hypothetical protein ASG49_05900 [Marmoricola sp. Leaf446]|uniref:hypothetical protein n=1 Tax=Marmoricola sp. Leaf446 TaxID=1736379 RepID=UPI0006F596DB|nr:hypothetical protein [Marmoricola sp. Leaf446]KQT94412.1 hypothetical protein ASG49_05900 [Marmoricola sp. Leaf446]
MSDGQRAGDRPGDGDVGLERARGQRAAVVAAARAERWQLLVRVSPFFVLFYGFVPFQLYLLATADAWRAMGWGVPLTVVGAVLFTLGFRRRLRRVDHVLRGVEPRPGGWGLVGLALACTLVGFAGPFWVDGAVSG